MKNTDWGKLIARLLAVHLAVTSIGSAVQVYLFTGFDGRERNAELGYNVAVIALAVLIWAFSSQILPVEVRNEQDEAPDRDVSPTIVSCVAAYLFILFAYTSLDGFLLARQFALEGNDVSNLTLIPELFVLIALVAVFVNARRVAGWMSR